VLVLLTLLAEKCDARHYYQKNGLNVFRPYNSARRIQRQLRLVEFIYFSFLSQKLRRENSPLRFYKYSLKDVEYNLMAINNKRSNKKKSKESV